MEAYDSRRGQRSCQKLGELPTVRSENDNKRLRYTLLGNYAADALRARVGGVDPPLRASVHIAPPHCARMLIGQRRCNALPSPKSSHRCLSKWLCRGRRGQWQSWDEQQRNDTQ